MKTNILKFPVKAKSRRKTAAMPASPKAARPARARADVFLEQSKNEVEGAVMGAVKELVEERGFSALAEDEVIARARVSEADYRALFKDRDMLLRTFAEKSDYWLGHLNKGIVNTLGKEPFLQHTFLDLMHSLYKDRVMQRMLIWGLDSDNAITRRIARLRESRNRGLIRELENEARRTGKDVPALVALLLAGIYYLVLHSERSTFCNVDFSKPSGKKRLAGAVAFAVDAIMGAPPSRAVFSKNGAPVLRLLKNDTEE